MTLIAVNYSRVRRHQRVKKLVQLGPASSRLRGWLQVFGVALVASTRTMTKLRRISADTVIRQSPSRRESLSLKCMSSKPLPSLQYLSQLLRSKYLWSQTNGGASCALSSTLWTIGRTRRWLTVKLAATRMSIRITRSLPW